MTVTKKDPWIQEQNKSTSLRTYKSNKTLLKMEKHLVKKGSQPTLGSIFLRSPSPIQTSPNRAKSPERAISPLRSPSPTGFRATLNEMEKHKTKSDRRAKEQKNVLMEEYLKSYQHLKNTSSTISEKLQFSVIEPTKKTKGPRCATGVGGKKKQLGESLRDMTVDEKLVMVSKMPKMYKISLDNHYFLQNSHPNRSRVHEQMRTSLPSTQYQKILQQQANHSHWTSDIQGIDPSNVQQELRNISRKTTTPMDNFRRKPPTRLSLDGRISKLSSSSANSPKTEEAKKSKGFQGYNLHRLEKHDYKL